MTKEFDIHYMRHALNLAYGGLGKTWPNPSVGCVIVRNGRVIAHGRTADGGRPHAEIIALSEAGSRARGATAYVCLEPCAVAGRESSCAQAMVNAGIARVVIACIDTNPAVFGNGVEILKTGGVDVVLGVLEKEARALNAGFFLRVQEKRPFITLKTASSFDGKVAPAPGKREWITGEETRKDVHLLRARHDAVLVGIGTVQVDNPMLNARVGGTVHKTVRIVLDSELKIDLDSQLVSSANQFPLWIFYREAPVEKIRNLEARGVKLFQMRDKSIKSVLETLSEQGITRVLVEGGPGIHTAFLREEYGDEFYVYRAPHVLGADGVAVFKDGSLEKLTEGDAFKLRETRRFGEDLLEIYERTR